MLALILYLSFADLGNYRTNIETTVTGVTGRDFRIAGEFKLVVFPAPALLAEDITLANAAWASDSPFLSVGHVSATIDLWSIISGPVRIRELRLQDVELLLEENEDGDVNWEMTRDESPASGDIVPAIIDFAELRSITVRQRRPGVEERIVVLATLDLTTDDQGFMITQGSGRVDESGFSLNSRFGPISKLNAAAEFEYSLLADLGGGNVNIEGTATIDKNRIDFDTSISPLNLIGDVLQISGLPDATLTIAGGILVNTDNYELLDVAASVPNANARISGVIGISAPAAGKFDIEFSATDLHELYDDLPSIPLTLSATATLDPDRLTAEPFAITFGDSDLGGTLNVQFDDPVSVTSKAHSKLLNLTQLADKAESEVDDTAGTESDEPVEPTSEWFFDEEPLPFDFLNAASVDLELTIDVFQQGPLHLEELEMSLKLADGSLSLASGFDVAAGGVFSTDIVAQLFGALNPFAEKEPFSNWECTVFALDITDSMAEITSMLAQSEKVTIVGGGSIDLNTEELNIDFNTKQRSGVGISADMFVTPFVQLAGTLAAPRIGLDKRGVLVSGGAAIMTAGASFFIKGLADRASGQSDRCVAALAIAHGQEVEAQ